MSNKLNKILNEYIEYKSKLQTLKLKLFKKASEVFSWENENLGKNQKTYAGWTCDNIEIEDDNVYFYVSDSWGYGGYDKTDFCIPRHKLISDDWKEHALKEYQEKLEKQKEEQRVKNERIAKAKEAAERAEYERLKAKFDK